MMRYTITIRNSFFFFNDTATTKIYTLSLHDALPIFSTAYTRMASSKRHQASCCCLVRLKNFRSEEHTSELQLQFHIVCRLLLEKKKSRRARDCNFYSIKQRTKYVKKKTKI